MIQDGVGQMCIPRFSRMCLTLSSPSCSSSLSSKAVTFDQNRQIYRRKPMIDDFCLFWREGPGGVLRHFLTLWSLCAVFSASVKHRWCMYLAFQPKDRVNFFPRPLMVSYILVESIWNNNNKNNQYGIIILVESPVVTQSCVCSPSSASNLSSSSSEILDFSFASFTLASAMIESLRHMI